MWYNRCVRTIDKNAVRSALVGLIDDCLKTVDPAVTAALEKITGKDREAQAARLIAKNNRIAAENRYYACQDTGQAVFFVKLGDGVVCEGLKDAITSAVREAYAPARKSVADPLTRVNTGDNTPPIIHTELVSGDGLEITFLAKGAGSENMTKLYMLTPADGRDGIVRAVVDAVKTGGPNACPPLVVGVGIGGVAETACMLAKRATLRPLRKPHERADVANLEAELYDRINALGIGVAAYGGSTTALSVAAEIAPTHIGMLPVAVNLQCHSLRHGTVKL